MPLYDILNDFKKGSSHMAAVVTAKGEGKNPPPTDGETSERNKDASGESTLTTPLLSKAEQKPDSVVVDIDNQQIQVNGNKPASFQQNDAAHGIRHVSEDIEEGGSLVLSLSRMYLKISCKCPVAEGPGKCYQLYPRN